MKYIYVRKFAKKNQAFAELMFGNIRWCRNIQRNNVYFLYMFVAFRAQD